MNVGEERIGFLEVPSGGQVLVRRGSTVDGGTVTIFDAHQLRIVFPDRVVVLELTDAGRLATRPTPGVVQQQADTEDVMVREVDPEQLMASLRHAPKATDGSPTGRRPDPRAEVGRRFALAANLPSDARVVRINGNPVATAERALADADRALEQGLPAVLDLAVAPGSPPARVYLMPATKP